MPDESEMTRDERRAAVERLLGQDLDADGRPLSRRARQTQRSLEAYLKAGVKPRWMERLAEIDRGIASERRYVERAYRALAAECGHDPAVFSRRWRAFARAYEPAALNQLIRQHNDWYPIERDLPMDPRTRDYVPVHGRSYRRPALGREWVLERFPAWPPA
jgi:hypothetical protein